MIEIETNNVVPLPVKLKPSRETPVVVAVNNYAACQHRRTEVDSKLAEVTCLDCKAKLNPIQVLVSLAHAESTLRRNWAAYRAATENLKAKGRCKCKHCGKLTDIPVTVGSWKQQERAYEIENSSEMPT